MSLPLCDLTEIPRLLCDHCDSFSMTAEERLYLAGWEVYAPATSTPGKPLPSTDYDAGRGYGIPAEVKTANSDIKCNVGCGRTRDESVFVCAQCIENLEVALGDVPALMVDLLILAMKQARFSAAVKGSDHPLPFAPHAADTAAKLENEVVTAIRMLCEHRGIPQPSLMNAEAGSRWLLKNVHAVAIDEGGPDIVTGILREHRRAMRCIDHPPEAQYIGLCETCKAPMHAREGESEHRCGTCSTEFVVAEQKAKIDTKVRTALLSLRELADLSGRYLGQKVTLKQLEGFVRRKRLTAAGSRRDPDRVTQLYRAADVVAIMEERAS